MLAPHQGPRSVIKPVRVLALNLGPRCVISDQAGYSGNCLWLSRRSLVAEHCQNRTVSVTSVVDGITA